MCITSVMFFTVCLAENCYCIEEKNEFKHNSRLLLNNIYMKNLKELSAVITKIMFLK